MNNPEYFTKYKSFYAKFKHTLHKMHKIRVLLIIMRLKSSILNNDNTNAINYLNKLITNLKLKPSNFNSDNINDYLKSTINEFDKILDNNISNDSIITTDIKEESPHIYTNNESVKINKIKEAYKELTERNEVLGNNTSRTYSEESSRHIININKYIEWINFYRGIYGDILPKITANKDYNKDAQISAKDLNIINRGICYSFWGMNKPISIDNNDWKIGNRTTISSILSQGYRTPHSVMHHYFINNDQSNNTRLRAWILDQGLKQIGIGQSEEYNDLLVINNSDLNNNEDFSNKLLTFPNSGVFPIEDSKGVRWSIYLPISNYSYTDLNNTNINIKVHDLTANQDLKVTNITTDNLGSGYYFTINYSVDNIKSDHEYVISFYGLSEFKSNTYSYKTKLFRVK